MKPPNTNLRRAGNDVVKRDPTEPVQMSKRPGGRPSLLTPEVETMFLNCIKAGNYRSVCAQFCGLSADTVEKWVRRGRGNMPDRDATPPFVRFVRLLEEAEATTEVIVVGNLVARSKVDHNAALAWLRAHPERRARWLGKTEEEDAFGVPALPAGPQAQPTFDQRDQRQVNVVVLSAEQVPDVVKEMLAQQRVARAEEMASTNGVVDMEVDHGTRIARLNGLRADAEPRADDDTDDDAD